MAKKQSSNLASWKEAKKLVSQRISKLRSQGFDIDYKINTPDTIRKTDVEWLKNLTTEKIKQGKSTKRFTIDIKYTGEDTRPSRNGHGSVNTLSKTSPFTARDLRKMANELDKRISEDSSPIHAAGGVKHTGKSARSPRIGRSSTNASTDTSPFTARDLRKMANELDESVTEDSSPNYATTEREPLYEIGLTDEQIDYALSEGISLEEQLENASYFEDLENEDLTLPAQDPETLASYYLDTETGEIFTENDAEIYVRKNGRIVNDIYGNPKIKPTLEHHINEPVSKEALEVLQWDNFISDFKAARANRYTGIDPTPYFEELHKQVSASQITDLLNELQDYGSNIFDLSFWYETAPEEQGERFNAFLEAIDERYGTDTSELRQQFNAENEHFVFLDNMKANARTLNL